MHQLFTYPVRVILICVSILTLFCQCALLSSSTEHDEDDPIVRASLPFRNSSLPQNSENQFDAEMTDEYKEDLQNAISSGDLIVGMKMNDVFSIWGHPSEVENAGDPRLGHQRWIYFRDLSQRFQLSSPRIVYFESGRVVGWKTTN